jgi:hypothetical protein
MKGRPGLGQQAFSTDRRCTDDLVEPLGCAEASWAGTDDKNIN